MLWYYMAYSIVGGGLLILFSARTKSGGNEPVGGNYELVYHQPEVLSTDGYLRDHFSKTALSSQAKKTSAKVSTTPAPTGRTP